MRRCAEFGTAVAEEVEGLGDGGVSCGEWESDLPFAFFVQPGL